MCGIAGAFDLTGARQFPPSRLQAMLDAMKHRGPDGEGAHHEPGVALGARRLAIVDPDHGEQPFSNEDGTAWAAFNGELFDYPDLRDRLLGWGHSLRTRCDSEAWPHLYEQFGLDLLDSTKGQFAVCLWDAALRRVVLARDRFGICPLYYAQCGGWLLWASEARALFAAGLLQPVPDIRGIAYFCTFYSAAPSRTCFEGVKLLPPGHLLEASAGRIEVRRYWDLDFPKAGEERRGADLVDQLEAKLTQAVRRRMRADVPVGSYLSGGLDSSLVLSLAAGMAPERMQAFSIGMERGTGTDESGLASEIARLLGSRLSVLRMDSAEIARAYPELVEAAEMPVLDTSCACLLRLASTVHNHGLKVVLTGEGADEAFAGYPWFKAPDGLGRVVGRWLSRANIERPRCSQRVIADIAAASISRLYAPDVREELIRFDPWDDLELDWQRMSSWHPLNRSLYVGYKTMLAGMLLFAKGDRIAMHSSVEMRYPFLDEEVVEWAASIAPDYKLKRFTEKWILREVARRHLPHRTASRRKLMFRARLSRTFLGADRPHWVDQLLSPESLRMSGWFDPRAVAEARKKRHGLRATVFDPALTCVVSTQLWHHIWCSGELCDLPSVSPGALQEA